MSKYLKLLFVALFASMTFVFTSCGDDDDDDMSNSPLVGTWIGTDSDWDEDDYAGPTAYDVKMTFTGDGTMVVDRLESGRWERWFEGWYKAQSPDGEHWRISLGGTNYDYIDDEEYYDDDEEWRRFEVRGDKLYIFFDGSHFVLVRQ